MIASLAQKLQPAAVGNSIVLLLTSGVETISEVEENTSRRVDPFGF